MLKSKLFVPVVEMLYDWNTKSFSFLLYPFLNIFIDNPDLLQLFKTATSSILNWVLSFIKF